MKEATKELEGKLEVQKQYTKSGVVQSTEFEIKKLPVHQFQTATATAHCSLGMTINIGNYEFIRVDCGVTLPTYKEELSDAQQEAFEIASSELFKRVNEVKANL